MFDRASARLALILLLFAAAPLCVAQQPVAREEQETVKVYGWGCNFSRCGASSPRRSV